MKHPNKITYEMIAWLVGAVFATLFALPFATKNAVQIPDISQISLVGTIIGSVLFGAVMWFFIMRNISAAKVRYVFTATMALIGVRVLATFFNTLSWFVAIPMGVVLWALLYKLSDLMVNIKERYPDRDWKWRLEVYRVLGFANNLFYVFVLPVVGVIYGKMLEPWSAMVIFTAVALYDAWAVWKSGTMVKMAKFFLKDVGVFPGFVIPYASKSKKKDEEIALGFLGGGDIFFMSLVPMAFIATSSIIAYSVLGGIFLSIVGIFLFSSKDKSYPAIPFMWVGAVIGWAFGVLIN